MTWQPIETAPEEGFFLVCSAASVDWDCTVCVCHMEKGDQLVAYMDRLGRLHPYLDGPATHWMPLPTAPTGETQ
jgi:hypothetical protein